MTTATVRTIDPNAVDDTIPLSRAHQYVPGRPHCRTPWRWAMEGVVRNGQRIRLQTEVIAGRRVTKRGWLETFLAQCADADEKPTAPTPSGKQRRRQARAATQELAAMGVGAAAVG